MLNLKKTCYSCVSPADKVKRCSNCQVARYCVSVHEIFFNSIQSPFNVLFRAASVRNQTGNNIKYCVPSLKWKSPSFKATA